MRPFRPVLVLLLLLLLAAPPTRAATLAGATLPDTYPLDGQTLVLNGMGLRSLTVLNIHAYVAGLYLPQRTGSAAAILAPAMPKVLVLQFLHGASKAQVEHQYREGEQKNCGPVAGGAPGCDPADQKDFEALVAAAPAVAVGDTTTYWFTPGRVRVFANTRQIGDYRNADLAFHLLEGFIGAHPPAEDLKRALLGGH